MNGPFAVARARKKGPHSEPFFFIRESADLKFHDTHHRRAHNHDK